MAEKIAVIGLGYVGLPLALRFAQSYPETIGFDINHDKIDKLKRGIDVLGEGIAAQIRSSSLVYTTNIADLKGYSFFVVGVPTPVDENNQPNLVVVEGACRLVGEALTPGAVVVFESTVYPGVTEEICGPILEQVSGLKCGADFTLGYSPERMNPGDREHTVERIIKVVSGQDSATLARVAAVYESVIEAGVFRAPSIKVAEAAKVIENTQRDLNIALMNELAIIFNLMEISSRDVLEAAATKWNFLKFSPGLVGGHCIGVDPYYLTTKAQQLGYHPQVILAGRRINDGMGAYVAQRVIKLMVNNGLQVKNARVGILGLTFKENVSDLRNSRIPDIIRELGEFGVTTLVHDPMVEADDARNEYGINLVDFDALTDLDGMILAVTHREFMGRPIEQLIGGLKSGGVFADVKSAVRPIDIPDEILYWSL